MTERDEPVFMGEVGYGDSIGREMRVIVLSGASEATRPDISATWETLLLTDDCAISRRQRL